MADDDKKVKPAATGGPNQDPTSEFDSTADDPPPPVRRRQVSFHSSTKKEDGSSDPFGMSIPRRVKLGKGGGSKALRDAFFLIGILGLIFYFAANTEIGPTADNKPRKNNKIAIGQQLNKLQKSMEAVLMEAVETKRRKDGCDLFSAKGSIPETGLGVYAGRRYLKGEVIYETSFTTPLDRLDGSIEEVSPLAWLVKFHPTLSNVENDQIVGGAMQLRTTRAIKPGEELFLPYEQHPLNLLALQNSTFFGNIPLASDYDMAELIQNDIAFHARRMEVAHNRRVQDAITLNTGYLYSLGAAITRRYAPNVAKLLPASRSELQRRKDLPIRLATLVNKTLSDLQLVGSCIGDAKLQESGDSAVVVVATRSVQKGQTLQVVPVHMFRGVKSSYSNCISSSERKLTACPLTDIAIAPIGSPDVANVALRWTDNEELRNYARGDLAVAAAGSISFDLFSLKQIEKGDKVRLSSS
eukprot:scaffold2276_cov160-Amphora_coffeaeformis.AAC.5